MGNILGSRPSSSTHATASLVPSVEHHSTRSGTERYGGSGYIVNYVSPSGTTVSVPARIDPYQSLGVGNRSSIHVIKNGFMQRLNTGDRRERVVASLSYYMITSKINTGLFRKNGQRYEIANADIFLFAVVGDTEKLMGAISRNRLHLTLEDEHQHTVLYLAARSGYHDTTLALIKAGAPVNHQQVDGSTPLHAASFYGQSDIVKMLLEYGANPALKNRFGSTPAEEAHDEKIKNVFEKYKDDNLLKIILSISTDFLRVQRIEHGGELIATQVHRKVDDEIWRTISSWEVGWHGTKAKHLPSIFKHGLRPSGTTLPGGVLIKPPPGHIDMKESYGGIDKWAQAIFVSPSLLYASHGAYAQEVMSQNERWCVLVMARVKPGCYTAHPPTTSPPHMAVKDEPQDSEFRISVPGAQNPIFRVQSENNVVVTSSVFILMSFLEEFESSSLKYNELEELFCSM